MLKRDLYSFLKDFYKKDTGSDFDFHKHKEDMVKILKSIKEDQQIKSINDITEKQITILRNIHNVPKTIPLFDIIKIIQLKLTETNLEEVSDYKEFISLPLYKEFRPLLDYPVDLSNIHHLIEQQVSNPHKELVTNAIDACRTQNDKIGKFGKGFLSLLSRLGGDNQIIISTHKNGTNNTIKLFKQKNQYLFQNSQSDINGKTNGTTIELYETYDNEQIHSIASGIQRDFTSVQGVSLFCNGEKINEDTGPKIEIIVNEHGLSISDEGSGMDAETICTKFFIPDNSSSYIRYFDNSENMREELSKKTHYSYELGQEKETEIIFEVGGVGFQTIKTMNTTGISRMRLGFPNFTHIPEGRNALAGTKEVMLSLKLIIDRIMNHKDNQIILNQCSVLIHALHYFEENQSADVYEEEYDVSSYLKQQFTHIKEKIESNGTKVLPYQSSEFVHFLGTNNNQILYVEPSLVNSLKVEHIPGICKCMHINYDGICGKKKNWYRCPCSKSSDFPIYIDDSFILIDEKYKQLIDINFDTLPKTKNGLPTKNSQRIMTKRYEILGFLNGLVNASTDYEIVDEKVRYGMMDPDRKGPESNTWKKESLGGNNNNESDIHKEAYTWYDEALIPYIENHLGEWRNTSHKSDESMELQDGQNSSRKIHYIDDRKKECLTGLYEESKVNKHDLKSISVTFLASLITHEHRHYLGQMTHLSMLKKPVEQLLSSGHNAKILKQLWRFIHYIIDFTAIASYKESGVLYIEKMFSLLHDNKQSIPKLIPLMMDIIKSDRSSDILSELFILEDDIRELTSKGKERIIHKQDYIEQLYKQKDLGKTYQGSLLANENSKYHEDIADSIYYRNTAQSVIDEKDQMFTEKYGFSLYRYINGVDKNGTKLLDIDPPFLRITHIINSLSGNLTLINVMHMFFESDEDKQDSYYNYIPKIIEEQRGNQFYYLNALKIKVNQWIRKNNTSEKLQWFLTSNELTMDSLKNLVGNELANHIDYFYIEAQLLYAKNYVEKYNQGKKGKNDNVIQSFITNNDTTYYGNILDGKHEDYRKRIEQFTTEVASGDKKIITSMDNDFQKVNGFSFIAFLQAYLNDTEVSIDLGTLVYRNISILNLHINDYFKVFYHFLTKSPNYIDYIRNNQIDSNNLSQLKENFKIYIRHEINYEEVKNKYNLYSDWYENTEEEAEGFLWEIFENDSTRCKEKDGVSFLRKYFNFYSDFLGTMQYAKKKSEDDIIKTSDQLEKECFAKLYENPDYRNDHIAFFQFMRQGGRFLENDKSIANNEGLSGEGSRSRRGSVTQLMYRSRFMGGGEIDNLDNLIIHSFEKDLLQRGISTSIAGQDKSTMLYLREGVQNARDAIKKAIKTGLLDINDGKVHIGFKSFEGAWMTRISDPAGMDLDTIINKLLVPGKSGKGEGDTGMFGIGLYTFFPGSKEVRIKTSLGKDDQIIIISCKPIKNKYDVIIDIDLDIQTYHQDAESLFQGTVIERIDEDSDFAANLQAMMGVNALGKYIGLVDDIPIIFNNELLNPSGSKKVLAESRDNTGLQLISTKDRIARFTKDGLYISRIPDTLLTILPDRMKEIVQKENLSIQIPSHIKLVRSRTGLANEEEAMKELQPLFLDTVIQYILEKVFYDNFHPPMLPEDYFYNFSYDAAQTVYSKNLILIQSAVSDYNFGNIKNIIGNQQFETWIQNKEDVVLFLLGCICRKEGKTMIDIRNEKQVKSQLSKRINERIHYGIRKEKLKTKNQSYDFSNLDDVANYLSVIDRAILDQFIIFQKQLCIDAGGPSDIEFGFYYKNDGSVAHAGRKRIEWGLYGSGKPSVNLLISSIKEFLAGTLLTHRSHIYDTSYQGFRKTHGSEKFFCTGTQLNSPHYIEYFLSTLIHELEHILEQKRGIERTTHTTDMSGGVSFLRGIKTTYSILLNKHFQEYEHLLQI